MTPATNILSSRGRGRTRSSLPDALDGGSAAVAAIDARSGTCWELPASDCPTEFSLFRRVGSGCRFTGATAARRVAVGGQRCAAIVFYPDGSTSDARLVLTNERYFVEVRLRGLTGMVASANCWRRRAVGRGESVP